MNQSHCLECNEILQGRMDKKFCSVYCKSAFHYRRNKVLTSPLYHIIDKQIKTNRRLLKSYNKAGKSEIRTDVLIAAGFNPKYFTHYWRAQNGNIYFFCYEYGFLNKKDSHPKKYVLITWQTYME